MSAKCTKLSAACRAIFQPRRMAVLLFAALVVAGACSLNSTFAQQPGAKKTVQVVDKILVTEDGWQIAITYRNSLLGQNAPVAILIPRLGNDRIVWEAKGGLAERLSNEGYAVISVDLRKQGQSKGPDGDTGGSRGRASNLRPVDYERMVDNDLEAVKEFLYREHQAKNLNMNKTAIIAAESSAPIAVIFAVRDWMKRPYPDGPTLESSTPRGQDIRTLILLSPEANLRGVSTQESLMMLRNPEWNVAVLISYGTGDDSAERDAERIYTQLTGLSARKKDSKEQKEVAEKYFKYILSYPFKLRGTDLLKKETACEEDIVLFLKSYLKNLPGEWRDRKNRLTTN